MNRKAYIQPSIKALETENLMDLGIHNSVGEGGQLSKGVDYVEEEDVPTQTYSVWDE